MPSFSLSTSSVRRTNDVSTQQTPSRFSPCRPEYTAHGAVLVMGEDEKTPGETRTDENAPGYVLFPAARRAISSPSIESCTDVSSPSASSDRAGGFGGFKKKGKFGRGNVRKRTKEDDSDEDAGDAATTMMAQVEKRKKTMALGGSTARDEKVSIFRPKRAFSRTSRFAARLNTLSFARRISSRFSPSRVTGRYNSAATEVSTLRLPVTLPTPPRRDLNPLSFPTQARQRSLRSTQRRIGMAERFARRS